MHMLSDTLHYSQGKTDPHMHLRKLPAPHLGAAMSQRALCYNNSWIGARFLQRTHKISSCVLEDMAAYQTVSQLGGKEAI